MSVHKYSTKAGNRWYVHFTDPTGNRSNKRGFTSKASAQAWETQQRANIINGTYISPHGGKATIAQLGNEWITRQTHLKPSSLRSIRNVWEAKVESQWGGRTVGSLKHTEIASWIAGMKRKDGQPMAATTKRYALQILSSILDDAVKDGLIPSNPAKGISLPKKTRAAKTYLTHEQLQAFAAACEEYESLILVIGYCGLRWGEAIALTTDDVDLLRRRIRVNKNAVWLDKKVHMGTPKGGGERTVPIFEVVAESLEKHMRGLKPGERIWSAPRGGYVPRPNAREGYWQRAIAASGVPRVTPHELRHTAASLAVQSGANVKVVQRMLGHASAAMTLDVYADLFDEDFDALIEAVNSVAGTQNGTSGTQNGLTEGTDKCISAVR